MIKVGITGQTGFIGTHLFNTLNLLPDRFKTVPFEDGFFENEEALKRFVRSCDAIVHLAAMNRHNNPTVIYDTNIELVKRLINACVRSNVSPHILFSSSIQEDQGNLYGKSKKEGRELLDKWAIEHNGKFTGLVIPNVFGPFGQPYYNSVVATFCHQLTHDEQPKINVDGEINLIYVGEVVKEIIRYIEAMQYEIRTGSFSDTVTLSQYTSVKVSRLLEKLLDYKNNYFSSGIIPDLSNPFDRDLFNTFLCYADHESLFPYFFNQNTDERGSFVEILKSNSKGQFSYSTTKPGITRGNHFHTRKAERFAVIKGRARIELRRVGTDKILSFELDGNKPSFVDMPIWFTHNITNAGDDDLYTLFWISEFFDPDDLDTYYEKV